MAQSWPAHGWIASRKAAVCAGTRRIQDSIAPRGCHDASVISAFLIGVPANLGYPVLFAFVAAESAGGLVPGETSLIAAGALAGSGQLSLPIVIATAAAAAIVGDNIGYLIGRRELRRLFDRPGRWAKSRQRLVERGEKFFERRGAAAVFFGRWLPGL